MQGYGWTGQISKNAISVLRGHQECNKMEYKAELMQMMAEGANKLCFDCSNPSTGLLLFLAPQKNLMFCQC
jgi:hypothetical protein